jgi:hypothetical protein
MNLSYSASKLEPRETRSDIAKSELLLGSTRANLLAEKMTMNGDGKYSVTVYNVGGAGTVLTIVPHTSIATALCLLG